jgi:hypothetical protein
LPLIWKILSGIARILFWIVLAWMVRGRAGKRRSARVVSNDRVEFAQDWIAIWGWLLIVAYTAFLAVKTRMKSHGAPWDFFTTAILGLLAISFLLSIPGTAIVTRDGIEEVYWFRRSLFAKLPWECKMCQGATSVVPVGQQDQVGLYSIF